MSDTAKAPKTLDILNKYLISTNPAKPMSSLEMVRSNTIPALNSIRDRITSRKSLEGLGEESLEGAKEEEGWGFTAQNTKEPARKYIDIDLSGSFGVRERGVLPKSTVLESAKKVIQSRLTAKKPVTKAADAKINPPWTREKPQPQERLLRTETAKITPSRVKEKAKIQGRPFRTEEQPKIPVETRSDPILGIDSTQGLSISPSKSKLTLIFTLKPKHVQLPLILYRDSPSPLEFSSEEEELSQESSSPAPPSPLEFSSQAEPYEILEEISKITPQDFCLQVTSKEITKETYIPIPKEIETQAESEEIRTALGLTEDLTENLTENPKEVPHCKNSFTYDNFIKSLPSQPATRALVNPYEKQLEQLRIGQRNQELLQRTKEDSARKIQLSYRIYNQSQQRKLRLIATRLRRVTAAKRIYKALAHWYLSRKAEEASLVAGFLTFSAVFIQRCYRGYRIRSLIKTQLAIHRQALALISSLISGYKTRRILQTRSMSELRQTILHSIDLLPSHLLLLKLQYIADFSRLYYTGFWVNLEKQPKERKSALALFDESLIPFNEQSESSFDSFIRETQLEEAPIPRDEVPIQPKLVNYAQIAEEFAEAAVLPAPLPKPNNIPRTKKVSIELPKEPVAEPKPKFPFLKRKSKKYEPKPLA